MQFTHLTVTQATPVSFALVMARFMAKLPTTAPRLLFPSTRAVETVSFNMLGMALGSQI